MDNLSMFIYVWKLNQAVLELDFWADKVLFFPRRDLNSHHWYTSAPIAYLYVQRPRPYAIFHVIPGIIPRTQYQTDTQSREASWDDMEKVVH